MTSGLTRFSFHCMDQRISYAVLGSMVQIPAALLSMYAIGTRPISRNHLPILAIALGVNIEQITGYVDDEVFVDEDEWSETNPYPFKRKHAYS